MSEGLERFTRCFAPLSMTEWPHSQNQWNVALVEGSHPAPVGVGLIVRGAAELASQRRDRFLSLGRLVFGAASLGRLGLRDGGRWKAAGRAFRLRECGQASGTHVAVRKRPKRSSSP